MANKERGETTLVAGERSFICRLATNSCAELEEFAKGRTFWQVWNGALANSVKDLRLFFWVALREHHPEIATDDPSCLKEVGRIIDLAGGIRSDRLSAWLKQFIELNQDQEPATEGEPGKGVTSDPPNAQVADGVGSIVTRAS